MHKLAIRSHLTGGMDFVADSPPNALRGLETCRLPAEAKQDFVDQTDVNSFVTARGGVTADWVFLDLDAAGVK